MNFGEFALASQNGSEEVSELCASPIDWREHYKVLHEPTRHCDFVFASKDNSSADPCRIFHILLEKVSRIQQAHNFIIQMSEIAFTRRS